MAVGWLKKVDFLVYFVILYILSDKMFHKCYSLIKSSVKSTCSPTNKININAFKVFQAISEFVSGNMELCR